MTAVVVTPSIRSRLLASVVSFLLGFAAANYGVIAVPRPDLWLWLLVAFVLMGTGVVGVLMADSARDVSFWSVLGVELFAVFTAVPLLWLFSVATAPAGTDRTSLWPTDLSWDAFGTARSGDLAGAWGTSVLVALLATVIAMAVAIPAAYGLVHREVTARRQVYALFTAALVLPTLILAAPAGAQLLALDLQGSRLAMAVPTLAISVPIAVWVLVRTFRRAPWSLLDHMLADGADRRQVLRLFAWPYLGLDLLLMTAVVFFWTAGDLVLGAAMAGTQDTRPLPATLLMMAQRESITSQVVAAAGIWWMVPGAVLLLVFSRRIVAVMGRPK